MDKKDEWFINKLRNNGAIVERYNFFMTRVLFPPSMPREQMISSVIGMVLGSDHYDGHEIETLPDGSIRLTVHLDSQP